MTQSPCLPEPKKHAPIYPDESREDQYAAGRYVTGWNDCHTAFMTALAAIPLSCRDSHEASLKYAEGYEAGSAAAAQAVPGDWLFRTKVADLLHLLTFASIEAPTAGDSGQARRIMDELRAMLAAAPTQRAEGAAPQAVVGEASERPEFDPVWVDKYPGCPPMYHGIGKDGDQYSISPNEHLHSVRLGAKIGEPADPPTPTAPQEADALREALQWIADRRWRYVEEAVDAARAALAQHQPQQGEGA